MKALQFNFGHPIAGTVIFSNKANPLENHKQSFSSPSGDCGLCIDHLPQGKWKASLQWEHDGKDYCFEEEFEVGDI